MKELREEHEVKRAGRGKNEERKDGGGLKGTNLVQDVLMWWNATSLASSLPL